MIKNAMKTMKTVLTEDRLLAYLYGLGLLLLLYFTVFAISGEQQFVLLARSFLHGYLSLGPSTISLDASYYHGLAYWPQGVFPAIILLPFVFLFHGGISQGYVQFVLDLLNLFLLYQLAFRITKKKKTALWLSFSYVFSTVYLVIGLVPWSWWFAQVVSTTCLLLMLFAYFYGRSFVWIGIALACAMATRIDLLFAAFFPLLLILVTKQSIHKKAKEVALVVLPMLVGLVGIFLYNYLRFGSIFEFGYDYHIPLLVNSTGQMLHKYGTWNVFYIPTNFYYLFLQGIQPVLIQHTPYLTYPFIKPDVWGMSIFLTSPIFLWCLKTQKKNQIVRMAVVTALVILFFILGYFGVGARQYGFRYALDFQPFLFIVLCFSFQKGMSWKVKMLIIISFLCNFLLFPSIFTQGL